jgi:hypothetical protein
MSRDGNGKPARPAARDVLRSEPPGLSQLSTQPNDAVVVCDRAGTITDPEILGVAAVLRDGTNLWAARQRAEGRDPPELGRNRAAGFRPGDGSPGR